MRNTLYLSIILALSPCSVPMAAAAAATADGLEARVSAAIAAQPLARALEQLSRSSGVQFLYSGSGEAHMAGAVPRAPPSSRRWTHCWRVPALATPWWMAM